MPQARTGQKQAKTVAVGCDERLWLTRKTAETHVRHILGKLALPEDSQHNRRVLAVLAYLSGTDGPVAPLPPHPLERRG
jgi:hypothetical protein